MFTIVCFIDVSSLRQFFATIKNEPFIAKWIRRIYIMRYLRTNEEDFAETVTIFSSVIKYCKDLEVLFVDLPLMNAFSGMANALCMYRPRNMQTLYLHTDLCKLRDVIVVLDTFSSSLVHVHLEIRGSGIEEVKLGMMSEIVITFPHLRQLLLYGHISDLVEQASSWEFPSLEMLTLDSLQFNEEIPDIEELLRNYGSRLTHLDIHSTCLGTLPESLVDFCPQLQALSFNADWRFPQNGTEIARLFRVPHPNITFIGLHGLRHAFGVGWVPGISPQMQTISQFFNDKNMRALNKTNFPKLSRIRILDKVLLQDLEAANGPSKACYPRYERWWDHCIGQGIRLEDCTGSDLGTLPDADQGEEGSEDSLEYEEELVELPAEPAVGPLAFMRELREELQTAIANLEDDIIPFTGKHSIYTAPLYSPSI